MSALAVVLLAAGVHQADVAAVADSVSRARASVPAQDRPSEEVVVAIVEHESHGASRVCKDEPDGSSSRGLMAINHKDAHCDAAGDAKYARDYDPAANVWEGVRLLGTQHAWHVTHCKHPHDALTHYAGKGPLAVRFAKDIRKRARQLAKLKGHHGR